VEDQGKLPEGLKRGYSKKVYHQRSKDEAVFFVIKRTTGDEMRSVRVKAQNNEIRLRVMAYNAARIASLTYSLVRGFLLSRWLCQVKTSERVSMKLILGLLVVFSDEVVEEPGR
jgi:hypothetical protein